LSSAIEIPRERVLEVARVVRKYRRAYAIGSMILAVAVGQIARALLPHDGGESVGSYAAAAMSFVGFVIAGRQWWLANHAQRAFTLASDSTITWEISDGSVVASDAQGVLRLDASFDLTRRQRAALTALPRAALRR
jgi:hypothetical protein